MQSPENGRSIDSHNLSNRLEAVVNLLYLIRQERNYPSKVLGWVELADEQVTQITEILRPYL